MALSGDEAPRITDFPYDDSLGSCSQALSDYIDALDAFKKRKKASHKSTDNQEETSQEQEEGGEGGAEDGGGEKRWEVPEVDINGFSQSYFDETPAGKERKARKPRKKRGRPRKDPASSFKPPQRTRGTRRRDHDDDDHDGSGKGGRAKRARADEVGDITKERISNLQQRRTDGTWVKCTAGECGKWRLLRHVLDPSTVHPRWTCAMNPDAAMSSCAAPQQPWGSRDQEEFVENRFTVGSVVWAKLMGYPWWPALVDDDPNVEMFFWTDSDQSDVCTWYHVVFFDSTSCSPQRAWIRAADVRRFSPDAAAATRNPNETIAAPTLRQLCNSQASATRATKTRLAVAEEEATKALGMDLKKRRDAYCFLARFKGRWGVPWDWGGTSEEEKRQAKVSKHQH